MTNVMVEGGPALLTSLLAADLVDEAPRLRRPPC